MVVCRPPSLAGDSPVDGGPRLSPREHFLYLQATQKRLARVGEALARWETGSSGIPPTLNYEQLQVLERHLLQLLARLALQWERRN